MASKNSNLSRAKENKNDEFYTRLEDIEAEISSHPDYVRQFKNKTVLCNCDDPDWSNFFVFFKLHFKQLGMKKLICTHYVAQDVMEKRDLFYETATEEQVKHHPYKLEWEGKWIDEDTIDAKITPLKGDGDFRSEECIEALKEADIVVTNPPFSLFREFVATLVKYDKKFIILGNNNAITYKEIFPLLKDEKMFLGYNSNKTMIFRVGEGYDYDEKVTEKINDGYLYGSVPAITWYTNLELDKLHEPIILTKNYKGNEDKYPKYDNYDAINVDKIKDIPKDYKGVMGVPITYLSKHCHEQFDIIGLANGKDNLSDIKTTRDYSNFKEMTLCGIPTGSSGKKINGNPVLIGKPKKNNYFMFKKEVVYSTYARIFIQRKES